jgi:hypothetical protein
VGPPVGATSARDGLDCATEANQVSCARTIGPQEKRLVVLITARPDATLAELREALPTSAALSTIWRAIDRLGLTVKKPYTPTNNVVLMSRPSSPSFSTSVPSPRIRCAAFSDFQVQYMTGPALLFTPACLNSNLGTLEPWNLGTLEPWNLRTLEPSNPGTFEPWNPGTLELRTLKL